jgi:hypothetical protein
MMKKVMLSLVIFSVIFSVAHAAETKKTYIPETPNFPKDPPSNWLTYHLVHPGPGRAEDL